ncbi:hypothetical protein DICPUDRAFT_88670 [Dictyostelium purpureum]|uniref:Anhydro-N-acetylmuramic acid kinase n=1 Tax=Dictyostelium purpureum TaxID=5786 RepID=F0ZQW6_DICPU|nr:uncharacterized protein DICPUDRAFT_88670 [Dictyostelium purpureum]EGC33640.1 hypothetical protein DICPUDRAFT_88670 [Dictyostelium purpureum]|eukprot:XP_003289810.1 hypothetical protein DICPUDRAFT_88670 [Dictyostelium purpureum]
MDLINNNKNLYIGIMSGTSLDGIDVVLTEINNSGIKVLKSYTHPLPETTRKEILSINQGQQTTLVKIGKINRDLGILYGEAVIELLKLVKRDNNSFSKDDIVAIGNHGTTVYHMPEEGFTIQLGDNNRVAAMTNINVVGDFRSRDIALGGQGAPLVPAFHKFILSDDTEKRIVLNIGGISNITLLIPNGDTLGFDTGPGNIVMDSWIQQIKNEAFDQDGQWAKSGTINVKLLDAMLNSTDYFIKSPPKSTGRELFNIGWLNKILLQDAFKEIKSEDVQATLLELTCKSIVEEIKKTNITFDRVLVCGGGAKNSMIIKRLSELLSPFNTKVSLTDDHGGVPTQDMEAAAFAWLAYRTINRKHGNLKEVTGASENTILGSIYLKN